MAFLGVIPIVIEVIILTFPIFWFFDIFRKVYLCHKAPGYPGRSFILGDNLSSKDAATFFKRLRKWSKTCGPVYILSASFLFPSINISGPEAFENVASTTKNITKGQVYGFLRLWLGEGLLTSTGSKWHTRRKILTPAFHFTILQQFMSVFNNETQRLVEQLKKEVDKPWSNVVPLISQFTLYSISETSMGTALNLESTEDKNYVSAVYDIGKIFYHRLLRPWLYPDAIFYSMFPTGRHEMSLVKTLQEFTNKIIRKRASTFEKFEVPTNDDSATFGKRKRLVFLDLLINAKVTNAAIDDQGIQDEVNTFMFEGHDTTAMSICFTLMLLANNKNYQDQIYQEILNVLGDNINPDLNDLSELKLMERVIKESLRLYPSVPFIGRAIEEDTIVGGYVLPRNTPVNIHIFDIHRNEKHWPDPEKFDPDRFLPENCLNRHPFAYVPFSAGPRNCIGQRFALLEIKAVLAGIIRNFILEPIDTPETIQLVPDIVLRTAGETVKVKFTLRKLD
nr:cytochrome P450 [Agasicles hygrophila]